MALFRSVESVMQQHLAVQRSDFKFVNQSRLAAGQPETDRAGQEIGTVAFINRLTVNGGPNFPAAKFDVHRVRTIRVKLPTAHL